MVLSVCFVCTLHITLLRTSTSTGRALNVFCKQLQQPEPTCRGWSHPSKGWAALVLSSVPIRGTEGKHWPLLPFHPRVSLCCRECCYYFSPSLFNLSLLCNKAVKMNGQCRWVRCSKNEHNLCLSPSKQQCYWSNCFPSFCIPITEDKLLKGIKNSSYLARRKMI